MKLVAALVFLAHTASNGDAAVVRACVRDCGMNNTLVIYTDDWESEGIACDCADAYLD